MHFNPLNSIKLIPHAIGRYIIEFPEGTVLTNWFQSFQGLSDLSLTRNVSRDEFENEVRERANYFQSIKHDKGGTRLEKIVTLNTQLSKVILYWSNNVSPKEHFLECDAYHLKGNVMYKSIVYIDIDPAGQAEGLKYLETRFDAIHFRHHDEIPTEPGTCFDGAILQDRPGLTYNDRVMVDMVWPDRPDVRFSFTVFGNGLRPDPPLLTRMNNSNLIPKFGVLRSGPRTVDGNTGEEHLERVIEKNGTISHLFQWEAQGLPHRFDRPQLVLVMTTGNGADGPEYSSLSDKDALKLWDAVLNSLRWRPTIPPTQPAP